MTSVPGFNAVMDCLACILCHLGIIDSSDSLMSAIPDNLLSVNMAVDLFSTSFFKHRQQASFWVLNSDTLAVTAKYLCPP